MSGDLLFPLCLAGTAQHFSKLWTEECSDLFPPSQTPKILLSYQFNKRGQTFFQVFISLRQKRKSAVQGEIFQVAPTAYALVIHLSQICFKGDFHGKSKCT